MPFGTEKAALIGSGAAAPPASGGTETTYDSGGNTYIVHTFTDDGDLVIGGSDLDVDYLIQASGGSGCNGYNGGGGAGGQVVGSSITLSSGTTYPVVVGASSYSGNDNTLNGDTAVGGGACDATGGCGGGRSHSYKAWSKPAMGSTQPSSQPSGATGYGTSGGSNAGGGGCGPGQGYGGAGGGGGTSGGGSQASGCNGGPGGAGRSNDYRTGSAVYYGGGGGGGVVYSLPGGSGGTGGGGAGKGHGSGPANPATAETGGGGGGGGSGGNGAGGSGIVVIRYVEP